MPAPDPVLERLDRIEQHLANLLPPDLVDELRRWGTWHSVCQLNGGPNLYVLICRGGFRDGTIHLEIQGPAGDRVWQTELRGAGTLRPR